MVARKLNLFVDKNRPINEVCTHTHNFLMFFVSYKRTLAQTHTYTLTHTHTNTHTSTHTHTHTHTVFSRHWSLIHAH